MQNSQQEIARTLGVKQQINAQQEIDSRARFLADYLLQSQSSGLLIAVSGGQDSALAGRLARLAVNICNDTIRNTRHKGQYQLLAVHLPHGKQIDAEDATIALNFIDPDIQLKINIKPTIKSFRKTFNKYAPITDFNLGNAKARMRMVFQYAIAAHYNMLVVGTDHAAEALVGFFTKYGDGAADILPLAGLTKSQGAKLLAYMNAPSVLYTKTPTADLLERNPQRPDEDELGITYAQIDAYLTQKNLPEDIINKIELLYARTAHKRAMPVSYCN